ncbi:MAG: hypothetical protein E6L09_06820 [Verrucomicrobia bacterium]|nr:MAG: hypothetical protein E6L09_06820 [Verrucomicrobiota bacterium]
MKTALVLLFLSLLATPTVAQVPQSPANAPTNSAGATTNTPAPGLTNTAVVAADAAATNVPVAPTNLPDARPRVVPGQAPRPLRANTNALPFAAFPPPPTATNAAPNATPDANVAGQVAAAAPGAAGNPPAPNGVNISSSSSMPRLTKSLKNTPSLPGAQFCGRPVCKEISRSSIIRR